MFNERMNSTWAARSSGKERDVESGLAGMGLDYFGARYYGSALGRFISPDPSLLAYADPMNPQSLNLYGYVWNNPLANTDPTGMSCVDTSNGKADDGDGKGCAAAGVSPSTQDQRDKGQDIQNPQHADVNGKNPSDLEYFTTISTHEIPRYDPDDLPLDDRARTIITLIDRGDSHDLDCVGLGYMAQGSAIAASAQIIPKGFSQGGTSGTSLASKILGGIKIGKSIPTPVGTPGTSSFLWRRSGNLGRIAGRYLPYVGTAVSLALMNSCLNTNP